MNYHDFLSAKSQFNTGCGFEPVWMPDFLFPFQAALVDWAIRRGRAAIFAGCGLGKTPMQLVWAENVVRKTNRPVLVLVPLAVVLWSNPDETVLTPFMGVGSEVYGAVVNGRRGLGIELKTAYYTQAAANLRAAEEVLRRGPESGQRSLFAAIPEHEHEETVA